MDQFKQLENGMLIGPQPTAADRSRPAPSQAARHRTVIDFRIPGETPTPNADLVVRSGLEYVNSPVNRASPSADQVNELGRVMLEKDGPFLMHCATGARPLMLLVLSKAKQNRWTAQRAFDEARAMGLDLEKAPEFANFIKARGPLVFSAITGGTQSEHWRGGGNGRSLISLAFLFTFETGIVASH